MKKSSSNLLKKQRGRKVLLLETLRKREIKRRFNIANLSHEFRNPIAVIKGCAETLRHGKPKDPAFRRKLLRTIEDYVNKLDRLLEDLMELSTRGTLKRKIKPEIIVLPNFIHKYIEDITPFAKRRGIMIRSHVDPGFKVRADRIKLGQVFQNLCQNAIQYSRPQGRIEIKAHREGNEVIIALSDTGSGIAQKNSSTVFDRFRRLKKGRVQNPKGIGIGLSIVRDIVKSYGGRIWVRGIEGKGSVFYVALPSAK